MEVNFALSAYIMALAFVFIQLGRNVALSRIADALHERNRLDAGQNHPTT